MYLVINLGLKSIRGIIFNEAGEQLYAMSFPVHTILFNERVEQNPEEWVSLLEDILRDLKQNTKLSKEIKYLTVTTSSSCILGIDKTGTPVTPVLMVSDKRASSISNRIINDSLYQKKSSRNSLTCASSSLIPKAIWYKENDSKTFNDVRYWLGAGEYLAYYFTGEIFSDPLNAGKAFYGENEYQVDLLNHFGISADTLPQVFEIGYSTKIDYKIRKKYDLHQNCTFILSTYDAICAVLGSSIGKSNNACDVSGTVTSVRVLHDHIPKRSLKPLLTQPINSMKKCMVGASNNLGGGIIEWYKQAFFNQDDENVYSKIEDLAEKANPGANGMVFLPYLLGERAPFIDPNATGSFFGIRRDSTIVDFTRAVFESTAYVTKDLIDLVESSGIKITSLTVSGGLARFDLINQIKADVCNIPVYVLDNFESTSIGAFVTMAITTRLFTNLEEAQKKVLSLRKVIQPSNKRHKIYNDSFKMYKSLNKNLEKNYKQHAELKEKHVVYRNEIVRNL